MTAAFAVWAATDGVVKGLAATVHPFQITWSRFFVQSAILLAVVAAGGWRRGFRTAIPGLHVARGASQAVTNLLVTVGLAAMPLADAVALGMTAPLFVTALSVWMLGESVGWRRWTAVAVGFVGTLLIVRPGTTAFEPASVLLLAAAATGAWGLVLTRRMSGEDMLTVLLLSALVGLGLTTPFALAVWRMPGAADAALLALNGAANLVAHFLAVRALALAPASTVAPIHYTHVVWASVIGALFFGTWPDSWTVGGAAVIVASGLYVWWRERLRGAPPAALASVAPARLNDGSTERGA
jgi:drug/metabolite transporter (DMT)-like permease